MGRVIELQAWRGRAASAGPSGAIKRLSRAVGRLDELLEEVMEQGGPIDKGIESEILAIAGALSLDLVDEAAERSRRLADRLQARTKRA